MHFLRMNHSFYISRRSFLRRTTLAAAASGLPVWFLERQLAAADVTNPVTSPNDRPGVALIGCGGQGTGDAHNAQHYGDIVAVCDVDERHVNGTASQFTGDGKSPAKYTDFRKLLERQDVHVVIQGTPDHWHTLINIAATTAGKDVYGEKPLTLTVDEGRHLLLHGRWLETSKYRGAQFALQGRHHRRNGHVVGAQFFKLRFLAGQFCVGLQQQRPRFFVLLPMEKPRLGFQQCSSRIDKSKLHAIRVTARAQKIELWSRHTILLRAVRPIPGHD